MSSLFSVGARPLRRWTQRWSGSISPRHLSQRLESTATNPGHTQYKTKRDTFLTPTMVLLGVMPFFTFALGTWQVERLKWKINLIDELNEKLEREPMALPRRVNLGAVSEFSYRKVLMKGTWDHQHAMLLGPRVHDGTNGYHLVEPLVRADGTTVLVDRGFISQDKVDAKNWVRDEGEVQVLGMIRTGHVRNRFTPDNLPQEGKWYWADVEAIADYAGGEQAGVQPVYIEQIFDGHAGDAAWRVAHGLPVGRTPTVEVRNSHVSYIVTWYSLSAFTAVMFVRLLLKRRQTQARLPR